MRKTILVLFTLTALIAVPAQAQTAPDLPAMLRAMQQQIDRLQAVLTGARDTRMRAHIDWATPPSVTPGCADNPMCGPSIAWAGISGWALRCGPDVTPMTPAPTATIVTLLVDGLPVPAWQAHYPRPDVSASPDLIAYCGADGVPASQTGLSMAVDLTHYAVGDHTVQWRVEDARGLVEKSNTVTLTIAAR